MRTFALVNYLFVSLVFAKKLVLIFARKKSRLILFSGTVGKGKDLALQARIPRPAVWLRILKVVKFPIEPFELWGKLFICAFFWGVTALHSFRE